MHIALYHNLPSGGAKRAVYEWTRRLAAKHRIDVYTLSSADHAYCDIRPFVQQYRVYDFTPRMLFDSPWGRLNQLQRWGDLGDLSRIGRRTAGEISAGHYDVVFAHGCRYTVIPPLPQFVQMPALYYAHEPFGRRFTRHFQRPCLRDSRWRDILDRFDPLIKLYHRRLENMQCKNIRKTTQLLANSCFTQEHLESAFEVEAPVCHLGVDVDSFRPIPGTHKEKCVLSVGELSPRKGFDFIVESLGHIPPVERPKLELVCNMVDPSERDYVEGLAARHGVDLQVLTHLNSHELTAEYNKARLCVYAPVMEPFGLVPLEAMACGTPVVGVQEGGVQESILHKHTGLLVDRDPVQFAAAVQNLLSNPALASEYGRNGREHVLRHWTWDQSVAALEDFLLACAGML